MSDNESKERILDAAEALFSARGYTSVRLRDIAAVVGMKHASLYYYVAGGKEQLFIEVMERSFARHRDGLTRAVRGSGEGLREKLYAVSAWLLSQAPVDLGHMVSADMAELDASNAERLMNFAYDSLRLPIVEALESAQARGEIRLKDLDMGAMSFFTLIETIHHIPKYAVGSREQLGRDMIDMLLDGWLR